MNLYQGMRWLKCDLQVQTPEDSAHWADAETKLGEPRRPLVSGQPSESGIQEKARVFLRRCHELELDVVGVTDHNFSNKAEPRDWFLTHLVEQNRAVAEEVGRQPLAILPGFEVDIGYHVLCLFEPATDWKDLRRVSDTLTTLGLPEGARFEQGRPRPLRFNNQYKSLKELLEVVQEQNGGFVIAAHADQNDGLLHNTTFKDDFALPGLLCVELTGNPPAQKYLSILDGSNPHWVRSEPYPAWITSSDAKSLAVDQDGRPRPSALGYRYTWMKMSQVSIEALRQACLDAGSRIRVLRPGEGDKNPGLREAHPRIVSLTVRNAAFVEDQTVHFSPNLNCIIGGFGSGKSSILEYLRLAHGKDKGDVDEKTQDKINRIRNTLPPGTGSVEVVWRGLSGNDDVLTYTRDGGAQVSGNSQVIDLVTFHRQLPVEFFSQQELSERTQERHSRLLALLDGYAKADLDRLEAQERDLRSELERLFSVRRQKIQIEADIGRLRQEIAELTRAWQARRSLQGEARRHEQSRAALRYAEEIQESLQIPEEWTRLADNFLKGHRDLPDESAEWINAEWFTELSSRSLDARKKLYSAIVSAAAQFRVDIEGLLDEQGDWGHIKSELEASEMRFLDACREQGLQPEEVRQLRELDRQRQLKQEELDRKTEQLARLLTEVESLPCTLAQLHRSWRQQFRARDRAADAANQAGVNRSRKFVEVSLVFCGDRDSFAQAWSRLTPDRRSQLGREWDELGKRIFDAFQSTTYPSPWRMLQKAVFGHGSAPDWLGRHKESLASHLSKEGVAKTWEEVFITRVHDFADIALFRPDGSLAGRISEGKLSGGQRNTAALALILAQGNGPLVIDQPEEELDATFIYHDLVPFLREMKSRRQIICATHNANLPVNGDAELVYALEARDGRGRPLVQGGLDRESVTQAVLDIMEGSREAFRRRSEKYHF